jgi:hypothetical protein
MLIQTEIETNRQRIRDRRKQDDHEAHLEALEHAIELRRQSEIHLHFLKEMNSECQ